MYILTGMSVEKSTDDRAQIESLIASALQPHLLRKRGWPEETRGHCQILVRQKAAKSFVNWYNNCKGVCVRFKTSTREKAGEGNPTLKANRRRL